MSSHGHIILTYLSVHLFYLQHRMRREDNNVRRLEKLMNVHNFMQNDINLLAKKAVGRIHYQII